MKRITLSRVPGVLGMLVLCSVASVAQTKQQPAAEPDTGVNATAAPAHPATEAQVREYMALTGASQTIHTVLSEEVKAMRTTSAPYLTEGFWNDMDAEFLKVDFITYCVPIYQKFLSEDDMAQIIAFYRSPAGKRILSSQQPISQEAQIVMRKAGEDIGLRVYEKHKDEIEAAKKKYDAGITQSHQTPK